jgi:hypothetical protein
MPVQRAAFVLAIALAAAALPARAEEARFDFTIGGIRVGALTLASEEGEGGYSAASRIDTAGVVGMFADFFFDGRSSGTLRDGRVVPVRYDATSKSPRALRHTRIDWEEGTPVFVSVEPPRSTAPDPAAQTGTLDPVSAGFRLFRPAPADSICDTIIDVFDGSRLSRLKLAAPEWTTTGVVCNGAFARIEGEAHSMAERNEFPFRLVFSRDGDGLARLDRIEAPTNFGQAVIARRD